MASWEVRRSGPGSAPAALDLHHEDHVDPMQQEVPSRQHRPPGSRETRARGPAQSPPHHSRPPTPARSHGPPLTRTGAPHPPPPDSFDTTPAGSSTSRLSTSSLRTSSALLNRQPRRAGHPSVAAVRQPRRDRHRARPAATPSRRPRPLDPPRPLPPSSDDRRRLRLRHPQARARRAVPGRRELEHAKA
jgi:hypothetical protein